MLCRFLFSWAAMSLIVCFVSPGLAATTVTGAFQHIVIDDGEALPVTTVRAARDSYTDRPLTLNDLQALANLLTEGCAQAGNLLCRADVPNQRLDGPSLTVDMSLGYVAELQASPDLLRVAEHAFRHALEERPLRTETFRRAVAYAEDIPGLSLTAVRPERIGETDAYRLIIEGSYDRVVATALVTNRGSRRDNPINAFVGGDVRSVFLPGDNLSVGYLTRPQSIEELFYITSTYSLPATGRGLRPFARFVFTDTSPRSEFGGRDLDGNTLRAAVGVNVPLRRRSQLKLDGDVTVRVLRSEEKEDGLTLFQDRLTVVEGALRLERLWGGRSRLRSDVRLTAGLDVGDAGGGSRPDGEAGFFKISARAAGEAGLPLSLVMRGGVDLQWADRPLLFTEEFSFGGGAFGRAYDFGEVLGEQGAAAFVELARPVRLEKYKLRLDPYLYVDAGLTDNIDQDFRADGRTLWSAGGGLRVDIHDALSVSYEAAMPLSDAPYTEDDEDLRHRFDVQLDLTALKP